MSNVERNDLAPQVALKDARGRKHSLAEFHGKNVVLFFFDADDPAGSARELESYRAHLDAFSRLHAEVVTVSQASARDQRRLATERHLPFLLLSDKRLRLAKELGIWDAARHTVRPATILIDEDGRVVKMYGQSRPERTARRALARLQQLDRLEQWPAEPALT